LKKGTHVVGGNIFWATIKVSGEMIQDIFCIGKSPVLMFALSFAGDRTPAMIDIAVK
jgi:hypothetical protein